MEANLTLKRGNQSLSKSIIQLEKGRAIIAKLTEPKKEYHPYLSDDRSGEYVDIDYMDQFDNFYEDTVPLKTIYAFIADFYRTSIDRCVNEEHVQYDDLRSVEEYYQENKYDVLKDFLNNRKS